MKNKDIEFDANLACYDFRENIINTINNSKLPVVMVYYLLKDICLELEKEQENTLVQLLIKRGPNNQEEEEKLKIKTIEIPLNNKEDN